MTCLFVFVAVLAVNAAVIPPNAAWNSRVAVTDVPFPDPQPLPPR
jgi:hypothetical protein